MTVPIAGAARPPRAVGRINWRGFATLLRRELTRYAKGWVETIVGSAFSTLLYLLVFSLALGPDGESLPGRAAISYVLPGLVLFAILTRSGETTVFSIVFDKLEGMIADVLTPPLSSVEMTAAYALSGMISGLVTGAPVIGFAILVLDMPVLIPLAAIGFAMAGALCLALTGVIVGLWAEKWDHVSAFFGFLFIPLTFVSGLFAPVDRLPMAAQWVVLANPVHYVIDGFRGATLGVHLVPLWLDGLIAAATVLILWTLSARLIGRGWKLKA